MAKWLLGPIEVEYLDPVAARARQIAAARILSKLGQGDPHRLSDWIVDAGPEQFSLFFSLSPHMVSRRRNTCCNGSARPEVRRKDHRWNDGHVPPSR